MSLPTTYSFQRYLAAKKSVDDRALNRHVWENLVRSLPRTTPETPLHVLEVGSGIGTMLERALDWALLTRAVYTAIDAERDNIAEAQSQLPAWAAARGFYVDEKQGGIGLQRRAQDVLLEFEAVDFFDFVSRERGRRAWDLIIAHAFMDLVDSAASLPLLFSLLRPAGLFYMSIVFDGATIFQPEIDPALDAQIEILYHRTMDRRRTAGRPSGDSRCGRHLFAQLQAAGAHLIDAGASDWVVFAGPDGYPAEEAYFLHYIINTVRAALEGHPDLEAERFEAWIERRHTQVEEGRLVYIAHQLDFVGRTA